MTIEQILFFALAAPVFMWFVPQAWRPWGLSVASLLASAWLISGEVISSLDLLLFVGMVVLTVVVWGVITYGKPSTHPETESVILPLADRVAFQLFMATLVLIGCVAFLQTQSLDLVFLPVGGVLLVGVGVLSVNRLNGASNDDVQVMRLVAVGLIGVVLLVLVALKWPPSASFFGQTLQWDAQSLAVASPLVWIGFSYIAFRLIAVLMDYRAGRLAKQSYTLRDFITYVLFFPAFTAGPIDRAQRFIPEVFRADDLSSARLVEGSTRIAIGIFKKFVIADSLALVSMSPVLVDQTQTTTGYWVLLYLYALQIYFDFSGYSDVAIGLGRLYGITLPENFDRPYLQRNIQQFWQRWHMTLSTWFRVYYFTPFSRMLIRSPRKIPQPIIIFVSQMTTMTLIGLWHGITLNFFLWGVWHGVGLFLHKMLADNTKNWHKRVSANAWSNRLMTMVSIFVTFHFVALGWVFFALPTPDDSFTMLARLFGMGM